METNNTTKTDKSGFNVDIIDQNRYNKLTPDLLVLFTIQRNQILEMLPAIDGKYDPMVLQVAENYAFIGISLFESMSKTITELTARVTTVETTAATASTTKTLT